jgi:hypothetical protein
MPKPKLINTETGETREVGSFEIAKMLSLTDKAGNRLWAPDPKSKYRLKRMATGEVVELSGDQVDMARKRGRYDFETLLEKSERLKAEGVKKYYSEQGLRAAYTGAGRGLFFGLGELGASEEDKEDIRLLKKHNPWTFGAAEAAGAIAGGLKGSARLAPGAAPAAGLGATPAAVAGKVSGLAERAILRRAQAKAGATALAAKPWYTTPLSMALEGAAFGAGEGFKNLTLSKDPITAEAIFDNMAKGAILGGGLGGGLGLIGAGAARAVETAKRRSIAKMEDLTAAAQKEAGAVAKKEAAAATDEIERATTAAKSLKSLEKDSIKAMQRSFQESAGMRGRLRTLADEYSDATGGISSNMDEAFDAVRKAEDGFASAASGLGIGVAPFTRAGLKTIAKLDPSDLAPLYASAVKMDSAALAAHKAITGKELGSLSEILVTGTKPSKYAGMRGRISELGEQAKKDLGALGPEDKAIGLGIAGISGPAAPKGGVSELIENLIVAKGAQKLMPSIAEAAAEGAESIAEKLVLNHGMPRKLAEKMAKGGMAKQMVEWHARGVVMRRGGGGMAGIVKGMLAGRAAGWAVGKAASIPLRLMGKEAAKKAPQTAEDLLKAYAKTHDRIQKGVDAALGVGKKVKKVAPVAAATTMGKLVFGGRAERDKKDEKSWGASPMATPLQNLYAQKASQLNKALGNEMATRDRVADSVSWIATQDPELAISVENLYIQYMNLIHGKMPKPTPTGPGGVVLPPADAEIRTWTSIVEVIEDPHAIWGHVKNGTATIEQMEAVKTLYPQMFVAARNRLVETVSEGTEIPYNKLVELSQMFEVPLTPLMQPENIAASQNDFVPEEAGGSPKPRPPSMRKSFEDELTSAQRLQQ